MKISSEKIKKSAIKTWKNFKKIIPVILGVFLLISFLKTAIPKEFYSKLFSGIPFFDSIIGAVLGSISAGHPLTSYIIGGELLDHGISLIAVTAFLLTWVTVGIVQLPAESSILGTKFAIARNIVSFISAIIIAGLVILILPIL